MSSACLLLASSCNVPDAPASPSPPLSSDQKQQTLSLFQSFTISETAALSLDSEFQPGKPGSDAASLTWLKMTGVLKNQVQEAACLINRVKATPPAAAANPQTVSFRVQGGQTGCSIEYDNENPLPNNGSTVQTSSSASVYHTTLTSFAGLNDVDSFSISGNSSMSSQENEVSITDRGMGTIHSQTQGSLSFEIEGTSTLTLESPENMNRVSRIVMKISFPNFTAELVEESASGSGGMTSSYALNGEALNDSEIGTYINPPFVPEGGLSSTRRFLPARPVKPGKTFHQRSQID